MGGTGSLIVPTAGLQIGSASGTATSVTSNKTVTGDIALVNTSYVDVGANTLTVTGNVSGGSSTAFIKTTSSGGFLKLSAIATSKVFPIGETTYNPLTIASTSGVDFSARVRTGIYDPSGAIPTDAVNRTWYISASAVTPLVTVTYQYSSTAGELTGSASAQPQLMEILQSDYTTWHLSAGNNNIMSVGSDPWTVTSAATMTINNSPYPYAVGVKGTIFLSADYFITARAQKLNQSGLVSWNVTGTDNVTGFEIERSVNNGGFRVIGSVNPSAGQLNYNFIDPSMGSGTNLYRIKVIRGTGGMRYSNTVALINGNTGLLLTSVAPNPVQDRVMVTLSTAKAGTVQLDIINISGNKVQTWIVPVAEGNNSIPLNLGKLPAGVYSLRASTGDAKAVYRIIKQ